jgi:hypothetical protein
MTNSDSTIKKQQHNPVDCVQQIPINDIKNSVLNIEACITRQEKIINKAMIDLTLQQKKITDILFGKDMNGGIITVIKVNEKAVARMWWILGSLLLIIVGTSIRIWFFS